ncbi:hypothetical protein P3G55_17720 [Leptospira sp. 96542]|nr:hypothetical protein [Leptospira sp. 96542]
MRTDFSLHFLVTALNLFMIPKISTQFFCLLFVTHFLKNRYIETNYKTIVVPPSLLLVGKSFTLH